MKHSDAIGNIAAALVAVQKKMKPLKRNADNPFFKSSYTDLAALSETVLPLLAAEGIAVVQGGDGTGMSTMLVHSSGEWIETTLPMPPTDNPQKLGSVVTYFRRYGLAAAVGAVSEGDDDDGNAASHPTSRLAPASHPAPRPSPQSEARPTTTPAAPPASGGSPALTLNVQGLTVSQGEKNGKAWTRYSATFSDGKMASTFDTKHGALLEAAHNDGTSVIVTFQQSGKYLNIVNVEEDGVPF